MRKFMTSVAIILIAFSYSSVAKTKADKLVETAMERTQHFVRYDPKYVRLNYPFGDVPSDTGVCSDVVVRSYRNAFGYDLQKHIHEDMRANFSAYPSKRIWGLTAPDKNIDHRRVPNLQTFFTRKGASLPITLNAQDYLPGDVVSWNLKQDNHGRGSGMLAHIGIVVDQKSKDGTPLIVHNIGMGPKMDNILFEYKITGHYRFQP